MNIREKIEQVEAEIAEKEAEITATKEEIRGLNKTIKQLKKVEADLESIFGTKNECKDGCCDAHESECCADENSEDSEMMISPSDAA